MPLTPRTTRDLFFLQISAVTCKLLSQQSQHFVLLFYILLNMVTAVTKFISLSNHKALHSVNNRLSNDITKIKCFLKLIDIDRDCTHTIKDQVRTRLTCLQLHHGSGCDRFLEEEKVATAKLSGPSRETGHLSFQGVKKL